MEKVLAYIQKGRKEGAKLLAGGQRAKTGALAKGFFVQPTIFDGCSDDMTIVREEIFGPVMTVLSFAEEDEVIARANDTEFGLAAGVFTRDLARGHRVIARLEAGTCWINHYNVTPIELPFGGAETLRPRPRERQGRDRALLAAQERLRGARRRFRRRIETCRCFSQQISFLRSSPRKRGPRLSSARGFRGVPGFPLSRE